MLLSPKPLQIGDSVTLLSTARKISAEELSEAIAIIESWGLRVTLGDTIGASDNQFAGNDARRLRDFQQALNDEQCRGIFCARGGYGTVRMMDDLDWTKFLQQPKWIVGFSDVTYLHVHINQTLGIQTLHAAMPSTYATTTPAALLTLRQELFGEAQRYSIKTHVHNRPGIGEGQLIGGNLSILYSITGTKSVFNTEGKILFLEDLDEQLYHLDRMMQNLKRSGKLNALAGLVVGGMSEMKDNAIPFGKTPEEIILDTVKDFNYPVCFGFPAGHIADNRALVMGRYVKLSVGDRVLLHAS